MANLTKTFTILFSFSLVGFTSYAQIVEPEVFATSGGYAETDEINIGFTIGEAIVETLESDDYVLNQGFHQTIIIVSDITGIEDLVFSNRYLP